MVGPKGWVCLGCGRSRWIDRSLHQASRGFPLLFDMKLVMAAFVYVALLAKELRGWWVWRIGEQLV